MKDQSTRHCSGIDEEIPIHRTKRSKRTGATLGVDPSHWMLSINWLACVSY